MQAVLFTEQLREAFRLDRASTLSTGDGPGDAIAVTELRNDAARAHLSGPLDAEDATLVCVHLRDVDSTQIWQDGQSDGPFAIGQGTCTVHDLRRKPCFHHDGAFHILAFVLPHDGLDRRAPATGPLRLSDTRGSAASRPIDDRVLFGLTISLLPFMNGSVKKNQRYVEHALRAAAVHVRSAEAVDALRPIHRGGLAPWQQRRAQELLRSHLVEGISLDAVATACGLSKSGFLRAFRESVGIPPHQWLLRCRIDRATELMRDPRLALSEIAVSSGFFDQSHFTRAFSRRMGLSPGAWRRAQLARIGAGAAPGGETRDRPAVGALLAAAC